MRPPHYRYRNPNINGPRYVICDSPPKTQAPPPQSQTKDPTPLPSSKSKCSSAASTLRAKVAAAAPRRHKRLAMRLPTLWLVVLLVSFVCVCVGGGGGEGNIYEMMGEAVGRRKLPTLLCTTPGIATCFASASNGDEIVISPGTYSSWDEIEQHVQITLQNKFSSITCSNENGGVCVWRGTTVTGRIVVFIKNNGGTTTLSSIQIKYGESAGNGGGLFVDNSNVVLILTSYLNNHASYNGGAISVSNSGSSTVTLQGCSFAGNTASTTGADVYNWGQTVAINTCPAGYAATQGSALSNGNTGGTMTSPAYSYSCLKECPTGEFSVYGQASCHDVCPVGSYISGDQACTSCPENSAGTTSTGSTSVDQCLCSADFYLDDSSCVSCGTGGTSSSGSTAVSQCSCGAGFHLGISQCVMECTTSGVATCFASASNGDELETAPGTLSSGDGIRSDTQLALQNKYTSIACSADGGACVWQGATGKRVVYIRDNGGTSTLSHIVVKDGDTPSFYDGGGLVVWNSNVVLILVAFIDNAASNAGGAVWFSSSSGSSSGSSSMNLHGCFFAGNTAGNFPDIFNSRGTVAINLCPAGYTETQVSALSNANHLGTMTSPAYSYSCLKECPAGEFAFYGQPACFDACPVGSYISGDQACMSCPENWSTSSTGSTSVAECNICDFGYFLDGSSCASCGSGTTESTGSTSAGQCICNVGFFLDGSSCASCGSGETTESTGSTSADQCICNVGFYAGESSCVSCGSGTTAAVGSLILEQVRHAQPLNY